MLLVAAESQICPGNAWAAVCFATRNCQRAGGAAGQANATKQPPVSRQSCSITSGSISGSARGMSRYTTSWKSCFCAGGVNASLEVLSVSRRNLSAFHWPFSAATSMRPTLRRTLAFSPPVFIVHVHSGTVLGDVLHRGEDAFWISFMFDEVPALAKFLDQVAVLGRVTNLRAHSEFRHAIELDL